MLLGRRYYDPSTGRFLTRDPIQDGRNWYAYCDGNPLKRVDPEGHIATSLDAAPGALSGSEAAEISAGAGRSLRVIKSLIDLIKSPFVRLAVAIGIGSGAAAPLPQTGSKPTKQKPQVPVYRLGKPNGRWWSPVDPRTSPTFPRDHGMKVPKDNPGNVVSVGSVDLDGMNRTWYPTPVTDYDGNSLGNGFIQIFIPDPSVTVTNPVTFPWNPGFFR